MLTALEGTAAAAADSTPSAASPCEALGGFRARRGDAHAQALPPIDAHCTVALLSAKQLAACSAGELLLAMPAMLFRLRFLATVVDLHAELGFQRLSPAGGDSSERGGRAPRALLNAADALVRQDELVQRGVVAALDDGRATLGATYASLSSVVVARFLSECGECLLFTADVNISCESCSQVDSHFPL